MINFNLDFWVLDKIREVFGVRQDFLFVIHFGEFIVILIIAKVVMTLLDIRIRHKNNNLYGKKRVE